MHEEELLFACRHVESACEAFEVEVLGAIAGNSAAGGGIVYLHPGSRLVFPASFEGDQRVVKLEGEAYFKVAKDASLPFVVMTEHFETTVLGTEFNIKTGNSEQGTAAELTLVSGSVAFKSNSLKPVVNSDDQRVVLKPGQQLSFLNDQLTLNEVDVQPYELWRDGYLY